MNSTIGVVLSIVTALGALSGVVALFYVRPTYRKLDAEAKKIGAEASEIIAQGATILLAPLQQQVVGLQDQVKALELSLAQERRTSQEERLLAQQTITGLRLEILKKDQRLIEFEEHLNNCRTLIPDGGSQ